MLARYWINTDRGYGFGVTAYTIDDAETLLAAAQFVSGRDFEITDVVENVDIRNLDQDHVTVNMGLSNVRGVWFPFLNLKA